MSPYGTGLLPVERTLLADHDGHAARRIAERLAAGAARCGHALATADDPAARRRLAHLETAYRASLDLVQPLRETLRRRAAKP